MYVYACITFTSNGRLDASVTDGSGEPVSFVIQPERGKSLLSKRGGNNYTLPIYFGLGQTWCLQRRTPSNYWFPDDFDWCVGRCWSQGKVKYIVGSQERSTSYLRENGLIFLWRFLRFFCLWRLLRLDCLWRLLRTLLSLLEVIVNFIVCGGCCDLIVFGSCCDLIVCGGIFIDVGHE